MRLISSCLGMLAVCAFGSAGTLSAGSVYTLVSYSHTGYTPISNPGVLESDQAAAQANHPLDNGSLSYKRTLRLYYTATNANDLPPSSVSYAWEYEMGGFYECDLFASTTTHYTVSGSFHASLDVDNIFASSIDGDSGTITQTSQPQHADAGDSYSLSVPMSSFSVTWSLPTQVYNPSTNTTTYTYTATVVTLSAHGEVHATAQGWSAPSLPEGVQPSMPAGFNGQGTWVSELKSFTVGTTSGGSGG